MKLVFCDIIAFGEERPMYFCLWQYVGFLFGAKRVILTGIIKYERGAL